MTIKIETERMERSRTIGKEGYDMGLLSGMVSPEQVSRDEFVAWVYENCSELTKPFYS